MSAEIDYIEWFEQLDARRQALEYELEKLRPLLTYLAPLAKRDDPSQYTIEGTPTVATLPTPPEKPAERQEATAVDERPDYSNMSSMDAALDYMRRVRGERTTSQIADALRAGGFPTKSPNFTNNVFTTMRRLVKRGEAEKIGQGLWKLTAKGASGEDKLRSEQAELVA